VAMHFKAVTRFIERNVTLIGSILVIGVIALYFLAQMVPELNDWIARGGFFNVIAIVLLVDILNRVVQVQFSTPAGTQLYENQNEAMDEVLKFIKDEHPKKADLLEYSTATIQPLLEALGKEHTTIRLLMGNPEKAPTKMQQDLIGVQLQKLAAVTLPGYTNIQVKLYQQPAALRGRNLDNKLINVGWYTYEQELHGHDNAMVVARVSSPDGQNLKTMFDRAFEALWNDATTIYAASWLSTQEPVANQPNTGT
jgi:hypothetical protein